MRLVDPPCIFFGDGQANDRAPHAINRGEVGPVIVVVVTRLEVKAMLKKVNKTSQLKKPVHVPHTDKWTANVAKSDW